MTVGTGGERIPGAVAAVEGGIERGLHLGGQLYVSLTGEPVADLGIGEARAGVPMTPESMVTWFSMTKPSVAVAVAQQWERGKLEIDDFVTDHIPEFGQHGKDAITLRHLLTHTAGIRPADLFQSDAPGTAYWEEVIEAICGVEPEDGWIPGERAGYHLTAGMTLLAEVVRRVDGRRFEHYVREEIYEPLGMDDCWVGMPADVHAAYGARIGTMHHTATGVAVPLDPLDEAAFMERCIPGGGGRGPMNQLARLFEMLLQRGELEGTRLLTPQTVEAITAPHRVGLFDETYHAQCDWGLGFAVDAYVFGPYASRRAFGHGGALSSVSLVDPEHGLVASVQVNGMCTNDDHYLRMSEIVGALYVDLGLAAPDAPGRDKPFPTVELPLGDPEEAESPA
ncbi:MAG: serine hydrolase domain-containing protein [Acidimicrobiia bacterium]